MLKYEIKNIILKKISQAKNKTIKKIRIKFDMKKEGWNCKTKLILKIILDKKIAIKRIMTKFDYWKKLKGWDWKRKLQSYKSFKIYQIVIKGKWTKCEGKINWKAELWNRLGTRCKRRS